MCRRRDRRTRAVQTLFGTVVVDAPRLGVCPCQNSFGSNDVSISPLARLLPDRCTPELRRVQAELGARHSRREAARLPSTLPPCTPPKHATIRNRTRRTAAEIGALVPEPPEGPAHAKSEIVVTIGGAHIRAAPEQLRGTPT